MKFSKVVTFLLALLLATAQFAVSARAQGLTSGESKTPDTAKVGYSLEADIAEEFVLHD